MANIKLKSITNLESWNTKELRKLRMVTKNRIRFFEDQKTEDKLAKTHPLFGLGLKECKELLTQIIKAEKSSHKQP